MVQFSSAMEGFHFGEKQAANGLSWTTEFYAEVAPGELVPEIRS